MTVDIDKALTFVVQVGILIGLVAGGVVWLKRWIKNTVADPLKEQVGPNGGDSQDTTRHLIEQIQRGQVEILDRLDVADTNASRNYDLAISAQTLAQHTSDRLDRWLAERGGFQNG